MISIRIETSYKDKSSLRQLLKKAVLETYAAQSLSTNSEMSIIVTSDERLRKLNQSYRGIDTPTDVLSFPAGDIDPETGNIYLGDIIISLQRANQQALNTGHPVEAELQLLVIHGTLHLIGFDHVQANEKDKMWAAQIFVLEKLSLQGIQPTED
jgi:probable rRNA maturation factor